MVEVTLGKTGITVNKNGFGALPVQRIPKEDAVYLIKKGMKAESRSLTQPGIIRTVRKSWEPPLREYVTRCLSQPRQPQKLGRNSERIWKSP